MVRILLECVLVFDIFCTWNSNKAINGMMDDLSDLNNNQQVKRNVHSCEQKYC